MYTDLPSRSKITLWCEVTAVPKETDNEVEPPSKRQAQPPREKLEDDIQVKATSIV